MYGTFRATVNLRMAPTPDVMQVVWGLQTTNAANGSPPVQPTYFRVKLELTSEACTFLDIFSLHLAGHIVMTRQRAEVFTGLANVFSMSPYSNTIPRGLRGTDVDTAAVPVHTNARWILWATTRGRLDKALNTLQLTFKGCPYRIL